MTGQGNRMLTTLRIQESGNLGKGRTGLSFEDSTAGGVGKPSRTGYGNGARNYLSNLPQQGGFGKPSKAGYGSRAGNYLGNIPQQGALGQLPYRSKPQAADSLKYNPKYLKSGALGQLPYRSQPLATDNLGYDPKSLKAGYGNGKYPSNIPQQGALGQLPYRSQPLATDNLGYDPKSLKAGALGQLPYRSQPLVTDSLGYDPKSPKVGSQSPYPNPAAYPDPEAYKYAGGPSVSQSPLEEEMLPSPVEGGFQQLGAEQGSWNYAPEQSAYRLDGEYGNGYRGCSGKC